MLKPLLLLCCAATLVSAGESNNDKKNITLPLETPKISESDGDEKLNATITPEPTEEEKPHVSIVIPTLSPKTTPSTTPTTTSTPASTTTTTTSTTTTSTTTTSTTTTSTTTPASTTAAPTTPLPPPSIGKWKVQENNTICIMLEVAAQLNISYTNNNVTIHKAMDIPNTNVNVTGKCGKTEQNLTLSWKPQSASTVNNSSFTLHFVKNETDKHYSLHHLEISLVPAEFPNNKPNKTVTLIHIAPQFNTGLSNSYRCLKEQTLNLTVKDRNETVGYLQVSKLQFQAFRGDNSTVFGIAQDCSFNTPDIVPITVGCALAGLVVVVLIAYLVGRRRSQARGYLSM